LRLRLLCAAALTLGLALAGPAFAQAPVGPPVAAIAARVEPRGAETRLAFELSAPVKAEAFVADGPRVVIDLPQLVFLIDPAAGRETSPAAGKGAPTLIKSFRFGQFAPGRARIVIELSGPARVARAESVKGEAGARLEIDLAPESADKFAEAAAAHQRAALAAAAKPAEPEALAASGDADLPLVVIDPGHGGVDAGALSRHGEVEKTIVLEFAKALKAKIEAAGKQRVLLTRNDDSFVALDDRVRFAQKRGAALLLSIHADTLSSAGSVRGATIYTGAERASDAEAARIAAKENLADEAAGLERKAEAEEVGDILFELARRETRALSRDFSAKLIDKWRKSGDLNKNPSRSAHFKVLKAHDTPSALLELGYLSSGADLANLTSPQWREQAAEGVAEAVAAFFGAHAPLAARVDPAATSSVRQR